VRHVEFAFRGGFHDPLRELRLNPLNLLVSVRLDTPGMQFWPRRIESLCQIVQRTWPEGKLTL
jgi:hypothetical protein